MKCLILMLMILGSLLSVADAEGLFEYDRVDFFKGVDAKEKEVETLPKEDPGIIVDEWAEPIVSPSGKVSVYVPPKEVKSFLEEPNPENAKAYLEWNLKRIKKFILAQELLAKESKRLGFTEDARALAKITPYLDTAAGVTDNIKTGINHLFYFMLKGCPGCQRQAKVIEDIYLNHPEIKIEAFARGFSDRELEEFIFPVRQDNGMSQLFKVNSYPAILVFNKKKERYFLSGYVNKKKILELFE